MVDAINWAIIVALIVVIVVTVVFYRFVSKLMKDVERAIEDATTEEQTIIRAKVIKALYPPRFNKE